MRNRADRPGNEDRSEQQPHDQFREFCALSISGELSEEEREALDSHLVECPECRQALKEFEAVVDIGVPLLHARLSGLGSASASADPSEVVATLASDSQARPKPARAAQELVENGSWLTGSLGYREGGHRVLVNWNYMWVPLAAALVLMGAMGIYSFQFGKHKGEEVARALPAAPDPRLEALEQKISDFGHERQTLKTQLVQRDGMLADLQRRLAEQSTVVTEARKAQEDLERSRQADQRQNQETAHERVTLTQQLDSLQASLQKTETELDGVRKQRSEDQSRSESLEGQIKELHGQLRDREQALDKEEELLAHDRDIRELMGARELYIAEVYDVAKNGETKKPYGRVFYTKGKSLVFYAYDLDQQAGLKRANTFQAWGNRGVDRQQATSLGVFYEDSAAKKRWVLKSDDPKKLEQIDAVFVTVEPAGGSLKPSGKPLLFAYLKVEANHP